MNICSETALKVIFNVFHTLRNTNTQQTVRGGRARGDLRMEKWIKDDGEGRTGEKKQTKKNHGSRNEHLPSVVVVVVATVVVLLTGNKINLFSSSVF